MSKKNNVLMFCALAASLTACVSNPQKNTQANEMAAIRAAGVYQDSPVYRIALQADRRAATDARDFVRKQWATDKADSTGRLLFRFTTTGTNQPIYLNLFNIESVHIDKTAASQSFVKTAGKQIDVAPLFDTYLCGLRSSFPEGCSKYSGMIGNLNGVKLVLQTTNHYSGAVSKNSSYLDRYQAALSATPQGAITQSNLPYLVDTDIMASASEPVVDITVIKGAEADRIYADNKGVVDKAECGQLEKTVRFRLDRETRMANELVAASRTRQLTAAEASIVSQAKYQKSIASELPERCQGY